MKKIVLCLLAISCFMTSFAQDGTESDFDRWKLRIKGAIIESDGVEDENVIEGAEGGSFDVSAGYLASLDLSYFFTRNFAIEGMITSSNSEATLSGNIGSGSAVTELGEFSMLLPTLMLQYHFRGEKVTPYIGAGVNYASFYDVKPSNQITDIEYENTIGPALQAGIDFDILNFKIFGKSTFLNLDAKFLLVQSEATIDTASMKDVKVDAKINPFVFGFGFGINL